MTGMNALAIALADSEVMADTVTPGVLGFLIVAAIGAALYFLMKNMRKHMQIARSSDFAQSTGRDSDHDNDQG
ncbi:hypothetical protein [Salinactinospora qingdaonensis]|uniref:Uncharacterized protein n=1 Tax=Salinactinospora qingdaonensis TaxID=702744 RepID=A0ABP7FJY3_9ACTN